MDKSEGTNFLSKTFSSIGDSVSKWYQSSQKKISIASLKRARNEKLSMLGSKVFEIIAAGTKLDTSVLKEEYAAILRIDEQTAEAVRELELMEQAPKKEEKPAEGKPAKAAKPAPKRGAKTKKEEPAESAPAEKPAAKKAPAKKPASKKSVAKKPAAKKLAARKPTTKKPAVVPEAESVPVAETEKK